jgi:hypothetical protein
MDKGLRHTLDPHDGFEDRGCHPVVPIKKMGTVQAWKAPVCEHGAWTYAGADFKRKMTKWRCPTGKCKPASLWRKASRLHPLIPRDSKRFGNLYRGRTSGHSAG